MTDFKDDAKDVYRRVEVLTGPGRRRRWSDEQKMLVAAEAMVPGAVVCYRCESTGGFFRRVTYCQPAR